MTTAIAMAMLAVCLIASGGSESRIKAAPTSPLHEESNRAVPGKLQANSLCDRSEHIIFSCRLKHSPNRATQRSVKIVSLCASSDLGKEQGYLQYRYGLPGRLELEFPKSRTATQQMFQYTHYMRYQVDLTEINFAIDGYGYQIFDAYNGEERPAISEQGMSITDLDKSKETRLICIGRAKADYSMLDDVLRRD